MEDERETSTLRTPRKKSSLRISSCFHGNRGVDASETSSARSPKLRSPWFRSFKGHETPGRCRSFIARMGRQRRHSYDFSYDPLSYSLNFNGDASPEVDEEFPARNFISRLPVSPPDPMAFTRLTRSLELPEAMRKEVVEAGPATPPRRTASMTGRVSLDLQLPARKLDVAELKRSLEVPTPATAEVRKDGDQQAVRTAEAAEVRRALDDATPAFGVSPSSREILIQLC